MLIWAERDFAVGRDHLHIIICCVGCPGRCFDRAAGEEAVGQGLAVEAGDLAVTISTLSSAALGVLAGAE